MSCDFFTYCNIYSSTLTPKFYQIPKGKQNIVTLSPTLQNITRCQSRFGMELTPHYVEYFTCKSSQPGQAWSTGQKQLSQPKQARSTGQKHNSVNQDKRSTCARSIVWWGENIISLDHWRTTFHLGNLRNWHLKCENNAWINRQRKLNIRLAMLDYAKQDEMELKKVSRLRWNSAVILPYRRCL